MICKVGDRSRGLLHRGVEEDATPFPGLLQETGVQSKVESYQRLKTVDSALLNTHHYEVRIKDKAEQSRE